MNVDLSDNPIKMIQQDAFTYLTKLRWLDLSNTLLKRLPLALTDLKEMFSLKMGNIYKLVCTCVEASPLLPWYNNITEINGGFLFGKCGQTTLYYFFTNLANQCSS